MTDSDLGVDYDYLYTVKKDLGTVRREFKECTGHQEDMRDEYGSSYVHGAMDDFTTNWDDHRKELIDNIEKVGKLVEQAIENFEKLDKELAEATKGKKKNK